MKHKPEFNYDCDHCKFSWNCGYHCGCVLKLSDPPGTIQNKVNESLLELGEEQKFFGILAEYAVA